MKEATGELNMTVITIAAIAALVGFFYLVIWPTIQTGMALTAACNASDNGTVKYKTTVNGKNVGCGGENGSSAGTCKYDNSTRACKSSSAN